MKETAKVKWLRRYPDRKGFCMNVYSVTCSDELKQLMMKNNAYYREEDGKPLYFTVRELPENPKWEIVSGRVRFFDVNSWEGF